MDQTLPALITILAVMQFIVLSFMVGQARGKYKVPAPAITGPIEFERALRVQQNTLEQLVTFLPALWLFTIYTGAPITAAIIGAIWLIGRTLYAYTYARGKNRLVGFLLTIVPSSVLALGAFGAILRALLA